jgi:EAL domain-containing protein (putative c-di-GMP-specific phosphodiesterase class I)
LKRSGLEPRFLELELTESLIIRDVRESAAKMEQLRALGVQISVDDFGTGYSSLSYLQRLPIDILKLDRSFVEGVKPEGGDSIAGQGIITLAHGRVRVWPGCRSPAAARPGASPGCDKVRDSAGQTVPDTSVHLSQGPNPRQ